LLTIFTSPGIAAPLLATLIGLAGVLLGSWLTGAGRRTRLVVPVSAGVLVGVVWFGLLPELYRELRWPRTMLLFAGGYGALLLINRYVAPVCPSCAHDHDHTTCNTVLHGFGAPLIAAGLLHSFFDGWSIATVQWSPDPGVRAAVLLAVALHKIPEGVALGAMVRAAVSSRTAALLWCGLVEGSTLAGGILGWSIAPKLGTEWISYPLGIAAGWLFYLGAHAVHAEWKRRGPIPAFLTALAGAAGAAAVQQGVETWFR
jgi:zinc transporter ZupT